MRWGRAGTRSGGLAIAVALLVGLLAGASDAREAPAEGTISGTVTGVDGKRLNTEAFVVIYRRDTGSSSPDGQFVRSATTVDHAFHFALEPGVYIIKFDPCCGGPIFEEYYRDAYEPSEAERITVRAGEAVTGLNAELTERTTLAGTVTGVDGIPLAGATVTISGTGGESGEPETDRTSTEGRFEFSYAPTGRYTLHYKYRGTAGFYTPQYLGGARQREDATELQVTSGDRLSGLDAQLEPMAIISADAREVSGRSIGACLILLNEDGQRVQGLESPYPSEMPSGYFWGEGGYTVGVPDPGTYRIGVSDCNSAGRISEYYENSSTLEGARPVTLRRGETTQIDIEWGQDGAVAGRVTDEAGQPIEDACVMFPGASEAYGPSHVYTKADGSYVMRGLAPGAYRVEFVGCNNGPRYYGSQYFDHVSGKDPASATPVVVAEGRTTTGIDGELPEVIPGGGCEKATAKVAKARKRLKVAKVRLKRADGRKNRKRASKLVKQAKNRFEDVLESKEESCSLIGSERRSPSS